MILLAFFAAHTRHNLWFCYLGLDLDLLYRQNNLIKSNQDNIFCSQIYFWACIWNLNISSLYFSLPGFFFQTIITNQPKRRNLMDETKKLVQVINCYGKEHEKDCFTLWFTVLTIIIIINIIVFFIFTVWYSKELSIFNVIKDWILFKVSLVLKKWETPEIHRNQHPHYFSSLLPKLVI